MDRRRRLGERRRVPYCGISKQNVWKSEPPKCTFRYLRKSTDSSNEFAINRGCAIEMRGRGPPDVSKPPQEACHRAVPIPVLALRHGPPRPWLDFEIAAFYTASAFRGVGWRVRAPSVPRNAGPRCLFWARGGRVGALARTTRREPCPRRAIIRIPDSDVPFLGNASAGQR